MEHNIHKLLNDVKVILQQEKIKKEESRIRGEQFNVFEILGLQTSEVRLHSAFLAELLSPNGSHGLGDKFLKTFVETIVQRFKQNFDIETTSTQVTPEYTIGYISDDYQEGGRIDLYLQDNNSHVIIIENKIYAGDQPCQLLRYHNFAEKNKRLPQDNYILLYLTLNDGNMPSEDSIGHSQFEFFCISYRTHILNWLEKCLELSTRYPLVRETIQQYIINLKNILAIMNNNDMEKYMNVLTSKENISTTIDIIEHSWDIQCRIRAVFIQSIKAICNELELQCDCDDGVRNCSNDNWIRIYDKQYNNVVFRIGVISHSNADGYRMDFIIPFNQKIKDDFNLVFWPDGEAPTTNNPLGWTYLWSESGESGSGRWWRWDDWNTLRDMTNGKMIGFVRNILYRIKELDCFKRISESLDNNPINS